MDPLSKYWGASPDALFSWLLVGHQLTVSAGQFRYLGHLKIV